MWLLKGGRKITNALLNRKKFRLSSEIVDRDSGKQTTSLQAKEGPQDVASLLEGTNQG